MSRYMAPSYIRVNNGALDAGASITDADIDREQGGWGFVVYHGLTPETETTTHQFWCMAIPERMAPGHGAARDLFIERMHNIIAEDLVVYEAQQKTIDLDADALDRDANPRGTIPADDGLLAMRRIIRRLHGEEKRG